MSIKSLVLAKFNEPQKCRGHCDRQASARVLREDVSLVVAIACPGGYVTRLMAYGSRDNASALRSLVEQALGQDMGDEDIRTATRYAWDMGMQGGKDVVFKVAYWNQNYGRTKSDDPNRRAVFACASCGSLFLQPLPSLVTKCPACEPKRPT